MQITFFEVKDWERDYLAARLAGDELRFHAGPLGEADLAGLAEVEALSVFIYSRVTAAVLEKLPKLKLVATRSTGFDHVDAAACRARGITVSNVPTYGENTVAEHTFALILMLSRKVHQSWQQVRQGQVERAMLTGMDLHGKTLGVVGAGRIGLHAIRIARGFGMAVVAFDVHQDPFLAELLGFRYAPLAEVLASADIVSLHCPFTPATKHLIGRTELARMKRGALLVNTARGGLVDTDALLEALESGQLAGAGLDVVEGEELIKEEKQLLHQPEDVARLRAAVRNRLLFERDDVVFTPHNAFNSREALVRILDVTLANLAAFRAGAPVNVVG